MDQLLGMEGELNDLISFALDFKKLQKVLKGLLSSMEDMRLDITKVQEQQEKWEDTLLVKVNTLEKQVQSQVPKEDTAHLKFLVDKMQRDHTDEMVTVHNALNSLKEEMATLNTEVIESLQVSNECKATVLSSKNDTTSKLTDLDKRLTEVTSTANNLARDTKEYASRADLFSAVQTVSSRLANTEKSVATEFGAFNSWKEKHEGLLHHTEDKIDSMKGDINMLKTITDELSPPEVKKAITNMSREIAKLRAVVRELSENADNDRVKFASPSPSPVPPATPPPPTPAPSLPSITLSAYDNPPSTPPQPLRPVSSSQAIAISQIEELQKEMMEQLAEQSKRHFDLRRDVSDLGTLLEALTTGIKGTDQQRQEYTKLLEEHSKQLSHLLRSKADISVVETLLLQPKPASAGLSATEKEELNAIREIIKGKANKTELSKIKKKLEQGLYTMQTQSSHDVGNHLDSSITRVHFRCLACDRLMAPNLPQGQQEGSPPFFDLAPQVAYRRWRVKEIVKDSKGSQSSVNSLVASYSGPPPGSPSATKRSTTSLAPITPRSSRPKSASPNLTRPSSRAASSTANLNLEVEGEGADES